SALTRGRDRTTLRSRRRRCAGSRARRGNPRARTGAPGSSAKIIVLRTMKKMRILIAGGDGYLGWPTAMHLSARGHEVAVLDNFAKRQWELEEGIQPLIHIPPLHVRVRRWKKVTDREIGLHIGDLRNHRFVYRV